MYVHSQPNCWNDVVQPANNSQREGDLGACPPWACHNKYSIHGEKCRHHPTEGQVHVYIKPQNSELKIY